MPEFEFQELHTILQQVRYTASVGSRREALQLIADRRIIAVPVGPAVLICRAQLEPFAPRQVSVATFDAAGCPIWRGL